MFSYEVYKVLHLSVIFFTLTSLAAALLGNDKSKARKVLSGISSFFILVSGMGLLAKLGHPHGELFPLWVYLKIGAWLVLAIFGPLAVKRVQKGRALAFYLIFTLAVLAATSAVYKF